MFTSAARHNPVEPDLPLPRDLTSSSGMPLSAEMSQQEQRTEDWSFVDAAGLGASTQLQTEQFVHTESLGAFREEKSVGGEGIELRRPTPESRRSSRSDQRNSAAITGQTKFKKTTEFPSKCVRLISFPVGRRRGNILLRT